jgi:hypothetical protein
MRSARLNQVQLRAANLPPDVWQALSLEAAGRDLVTARRTLLLALLWQQNYQIQSALIARIRYRLGLGSFGTNSALTFRRDMQAVKASLAAAGFELKFSRRAERPGYYIAGRPDLAPETVAAIRHALQEVDPRQVNIWRRLTAAQRVTLVTRSSNSVRTIAVQRLQQARPELDHSAARREVLRRYYAAND